MNRKKRQILAIIGIVLLVLMYLINIILALIGTEWSRNLLKGTIVMSLMIPILLYAFLVIMQKSSRFRKDPEEELTPEERETIRQILLEQKSQDTDDTNIQD